MMRQKLKIGIVGCGAIGSEIARACKTILKHKISLVALYDIDKKKIKSLEREIGQKIGTATLNLLMKKCGLIVEAASGDVSWKILDLAIKNNKDIMIMSVGGLLKRKHLLEKASKKGIKVYLPSGALAGIDALKAASVSKIDSVTLTTSKPRMGLSGAPHLAKCNMDLSKIKKETVVFQGTAEQAVSGFPKNINISALLSLAGIGERKTKVKIIVSPRLSKNMHRVEIKGDFGIIRTETLNVPSPTNPKTSWLAVLSAIATLKNIVDTVKIGT